jgi:hypothetical protein
MIEKIKEFTETLIGLADQIRDAQINELSINERISEIDQKILRKEADVKSEIASAVDESGKKLYSNDDSRKTAFVLAMEENVELVDLHKSKSDLTHSLHESRIDIEYLHNTQRNLRCILQTYIPEVD